MMKRKIYALLICSMLLAVTACGKKENEGNTVEQGSEQAEEKEPTQEVEQESSTKDGDILLGVYEGATGYVSVPMGTYFDGVQKNFCKIKMPNEYILSAMYTENGKDSTTNDDISGFTVETAGTEFDKQEMASCWIYLMSAGGTKMSFSIVPASTRTLEGDMEYAGDYKEISKNGKRAIYFVDSGATSDVCVSYELSKNALVYISYEGPVADEIGIDQLAENIYDLVEVIE